MKHVPVLLDEVLEVFDLDAGLSVLDCTLGDAGHAEAMLERISPDGTLVGIDADPEAVVRAKHFLESFGEQAVVVRDNFLHIDTIISGLGFTCVDRILFDLGWSSPQFAERGRGFSFLQSDEPLDMRFSSDVGNLEKRPNKTAGELVNSASPDVLVRIFREYGEEKLAHEIAGAIVVQRTKEAITTVKQLVEIILEVYRKKTHTTKEVPWIGGLHPATRVFQALRIAVNKELEVLEGVLPKALSLLCPGGRLAVISFHSLEDRLVKHFFKSHIGKGYRVLTKKPIVPSSEECKVNTRARSAKLRVIEKI